MKIGESTAEFDLLPVQGDGAVGAQTGGLNLCGNIVIIDAEEPPDPGLFQYPGIRQPWFFPARVPCFP